MKSEVRATPWVEVALITLSTSEKVTGRGNTGELPRIHLPYLSSDKPVLVESTLYTTYMYRYCALTVRCTAQVTISTNLHSKFCENSWGRACKGDHRNFRHPNDPVYYNLGTYRTGSASPFPLSMHAL